MRQPAPWWKILGVFTGMATAAFGCAYFVCQNVLYDILLRQIGQEDSVDELIRSGPCILISFLIAAGWGGTFGFLAASLYRRATRQTQSELDIKSTAMRIASHAGNLGGDLYTDDSPNLKSSIRDHEAICRTNKKRARAMLGPFFDSPDPNAKHIAERIATVTALKYDELAEELGKLKSKSKQQIKPKLRELAKVAETLHHEILSFIT